MAQEQNFAADGRRWTPIEKLNKPQIQADKRG